MKKKMMPKMAKGKAPFPFAAKKGAKPMPKAKKKAY
jgi:hypothetical protein